MKFIRIRLLFFFVLFSLAGCSVNDEPLNVDMAQNDYEISREDIEAEMEVAGMAMADDPITRILFVEGDGEDEDEYAVVLSPDDAVLNDLEAASGQESDESVDSEFGR